MAWHGMAWPRMARGLTWLARRLSNRLPDLVRDKDRLPLLERHPLDERDADGTLRPRAFHPRHDRRDVVVWNCEHYHRRVGNCFPDVWLRPYRLWQLDAWKVYHYSLTTH